MNIYSRLRNARKALAPLLWVLGSLLFLSPAAQACQAPDRERAIAQVLSQHPGGKILKVEEKKSKKCTDLKIRVLVNGTVKLVVIKGN